MYGKKREGEESWQEAMERVLEGKGKDERRRRREG